jgi:hypothetical protein
MKSSLILAKIRKPKSRGGGAVFRLVWLTVILCLILMVLGGATEPFSEIKGPVRTMEEWSYKVEERFGQYVKILDGHKKAFYDENLNPIEEIIYTQSGVIKQRYLRKYDVNGRLLEVRVYDGKGTLTETGITEYDAKGALEKTYSSTGQLKGASRVEFDEKGRLIRVTMYNPRTGEPESVYEQSYTLDGKLSWSLFTTKDAQLLISYSYNVEDMDDVAETVTYIRGVKLFSQITGTKIISVDSYGNWMEMRTFEKKERFGRVEWVPLTLSQRVFTYRGQTSDSGPFSSALEGKAVLPGTTDSFKEASGPEHVFMIGMAVLPGYSQEEQRFVPVPWIKWGSLATDSKGEISIGGFHLLLGIWNRYYNGSITQTVKYYWGWGTWVLVLPYFELGVSWFDNRGPFLSIGVFYILPYVEFLIRF